jgi:hypothetical protein
MRHSCAPVRCSNARSETTEGACLCRSVGCQHRFDRFACLLAGLPSVADLVIVLEVIRDRPERLRSRHPALQSEGKQADDV